MRWTTLGAAVAVLGSNCADAVSFPRAVHGKGFLSIPVGTVDKPKKTKRDDEGSILTTLENMNFFYATDRKLLSCCIPVPSMPTDIFTSQLRLANPLRESLSS